MLQWNLIDGHFVEEEKSCLHVRDLSIQRGYGIFDFMKVIKSRPFLAGDHLDRFFFSVAQMHLPVNWTKDELLIQILELISRNSMVHGGIRLTLTGGNAPDGYNIHRPSLVITTSTFSTSGIEMFEKGIELVTWPHQRQLPAVKTIDYIMAIWLQPWMKKNGADDVLYHYDGAVTECPRSNFFLVMEDNCLVTPAENILHGVTRKKLLEIAKGTCSVEERTVTLHDLRKAREAFITSTTKTILPVSRIDDRKFISPGPITKKLYDSFLQWQQSVE